MKTLLKKIQELDAEKMSSFLALLTTGGRNRKQCVFRNFRELMGVPIPKGCNDCRNCIIDCLLEEIEE